MFLVIASQALFAQQPTPCVPNACFFGRVVDEHGNGIPKILVRPLVRTDAQDKPYYTTLGGAVTDEDGYYDVEVDAAHLRGNIYLFAVQYNAGPRRDQKPHADFIQGFYPKAANRQESTPIKAEPGFHSGFEIRLHTSRPSFSVSGTLSGDLPAGGSERAFVQLVFPDDQAFLRATDYSPMKPDRSFDVAGVKPGTYELVVIKGGQWPDIHRCSPLIRVGAANLNGIRLQCRPRTSD
jgi:hypothetical protein